MSELDNELTKLIRDDIKRKGLVDSGALLNSITVTSDIFANSIILNVEAEDYFQFVDKRYNIMDDVLSSSKWQNALDAAMLELIEKRLG